MKNKQDQIRILIDPKTKKRFKVKCIRQSLSMTDVLLEYIKYFITNNDKKTGNKKGDSTYIGGTSSID